MTSLRGANGFNNLLFYTKRAANDDKLEHLAGRVPLDLSFKEPARPDELLTASKSQLNGKFGNLKYIPNTIQSRPYLNHNAGYDPTILDAVRNKFINVSGVLIPNKELRKKSDTNMTIHPFVPYDIIA